MSYNGAINNLLGKRISGYCEGYFGRDSYDDKIIIMNGENWVIAQSNDGLPEVAYFDDMEEMMDWFNKNKDETSIWQ